MTTSLSQNECGIMKVELTVHTLHGIQVNRDILNNRDVTAAVAFTSSATDMEVASSTLCSTSGRLMVESQPMNMVGGNETSPLSASWFDKNRSSPKDYLPHVSLTVPVSQQAQIISLSRSNRFVLEETYDENALNASRACDTCSAKSTHPCPDDSPYQSNGAMWSSSKALLPEIIEMTIKLRVTEEEDSREIHGVAFLVIFGHQETGSFLLNLPVRVPENSLDAQKEVGLLKDARLVVNVQLIPQTMDYTSALSPLYLPASHQNYATDLSSRAAHAKISSLLNIIEKNEKEALELLETQKRAMDVMVPHQYTSSKERAFLDTASGSFLALATFNKKAFLNIDQCGVGVAVKAHFSFRGDNDSVASTIATQDSSDSSEV